ncbi:NPFF2 protein, partial [Amia calva]|nr:NPFF2 protein [Amia calva]
MNTRLDPNQTSMDTQNWLFQNNSQDYFYPQYNTTYVGFYLHQPPVAAVFIISYLLIFLVCMVGNGVVCFIVLRSKHMRTVTNLFILNLAVSDLLVGIFCMPTTLLDNIITGWPFGSLVCKMSGMVQGISVSASVFTLVAIAVDRIGITLFKTAVPVCGKPGHVNRQTVSKKKQRVIKMLLIVALLFILSWLPLWTLMMLSDYANLSEYQLRVINIYIYPFAHWLAFFNSSVNPIIYGFFNENFRRGFQAAFKFQLCAAETQHRETYSHRVQGNAVLPTGIQLTNDPLSRNSDSMDTHISKRNNNQNEQDLVMEDLEKVSNGNGIQ